MNAANVDGFALVDREAAGRCGQLDDEPPVGAFDPPDDDPPDDELSDDELPDDELEDADELDAVDDAAPEAAEPDPESDDDEMDTFSAPLLAPSFEPSFELLPPLLAAPLRESFR